MYAIKCCLSYTPVYNGREHGNMFSVVKTRPELGCPRLGAFFYKESNNG